MASGACISFFAGVTLGHDGGTEAVSKVVGEFVELGVAVDFDSLLGSVADYVTVVAPGKMVLQLNFGVFVEDSVQIVG